MAHITVLGGTGYAGSAIAREARRRGHEVTAVSRSPAPDGLRGIAHVVGSALDDAVLDRVLAGRDVVVEAISPRGEMAGQVEGLLDRLIDRAASTGLRLAVIGGASSLLVSEDGPRLYDVSDIPPDTRPEIDTGIALLDELRRAPEDLDWFYLSPPEEFGAWAPAPVTGTYRLSDDVLLRDEEGRSTISAADLALAVLDEVEHPTHQRRRFHAAH